MEAVMQLNIREIFDGNIRLLGQIDKAVILFREGCYDLALEAIADTGDGINSLCDAIITNRDYFQLVSTDSVAEMLKGILEAKQKRDYVLLADLYEMQLSVFICNVQELILKKEDFLEFDEERYGHNIAVLEAALDKGMKYIADELSFRAGEPSEEDEHRADELLRMKINRNAELESPLSPEQLLDMGYSVEFTSCGLMTMKAPMPDGSSIYLHTNGRIATESFLQARVWAREDADTYIIYGYGMGYHVAALKALKPEARIIVFESDVNTLKLCAAFSDMTALSESGIYPVYDPDGQLVEKRLAVRGSREFACVHMPSFRRCVPGQWLAGLVPKSALIEEC